MNIEDEYYFFIEKALTNTDKNKQYLFHKNDNILFCIAVDKNIKRFSFRNKQVSENDNFMTQNITKSIPINSEIIEIPKLTFSEKKSFIRDFFNQSDEMVKEILKDELMRFNEQTDFSNTFIEKLQKYDRELAYDYHMLMGSFFKTKTEEKLNPIGIDNNATVLW